MEKNITDLAGWTSTKDRHIDSRMFLRPRAPAKQLDFLYWFRQTVAPINAVLSQNRKHNYATVLQRKSVNIANCLADCAMHWPKAKMSHLLHIHVKLLNIHTIFSHNYSIV